jgi:hypothetical protein
MRQWLENQLDIVTGIGIGLYLGHPDDITALVCSGLLVLMLIRWMVRWRRQGTRELAECVAAQIAEGQARKSRSVDLSEGYGLTECDSAAPTTSTKG